MTTAMMIVVLACAAVETVVAVAERIGGYTAVRESGRAEGDSLSKVQRREAAPENVAVEGSRETYAGGTRKGPAGHALGRDEDDPLRVEELDYGQ